METALYFQRIKFYSLQMQYLTNTMLSSKETTVQLLILVEKLLVFHQWVGC